MDMQHREVTAENLEQLSLLALDALPPDAADDLRDHVDGCTLCGRELARLRECLEIMPLALSPVQPPAAVKEGLFRRVRAYRPAPAIDFEGLDWKPTGLQGVARHVLREDAATDYSIALLKMSPGSRLPDHHHEGVEDCLVLRGRMRDDTGEYGPGGFVHYGPGTDHHGIRCLDDGECVLLIVSGGMTPLPSPVGA